MKTPWQEYSVVVCFYKWSGSSRVPFQDWLILSGRLLLTELMVSIPRLVSLLVGNFHLYKKDKILPLLGAVSQQAFVLLRSWTSQQTHGKCSCPVSLRHYLLFSNKKTNIHLRKAAEKSAIPRASVVRRKNYGRLIWKVGYRTVKRKSWYI